MTDLPRAHRRALRHPVGEPRRGRDRRSPRGRAAGGAVARDRAGRRQPRGPDRPRSRPARLVLAGHTDTVPADGNAVPHIEGDALLGLGSTDMKAGLAVMLELARTVADPVVDVTYVFYAAGGGRRGAQRPRPPLPATGPTCWPATSPCSASRPTRTIEAGCQGTLRIEVTLHGVRSHPARPWMGRNAIHRLGALLRLVDALRGAGPCSTAASSARPCKPFGSRAGWPATWCPIGRPSPSTTGSLRTARTTRPRRASAS